MITTLNLSYRIKPVNSTPISKLLCTKRFLVQVVIGYLRDLDDIAVLRPLTSQQYQLPRGRFSDPGIDGIDNPPCSQKNTLTPAYPSRVPRNAWRPFDRSDGIKRVYVVL